MNRTMVIGLVVIVAIVAYAWYAANERGRFYVEAEVAPPVTPPQMAPSRLALLPGEDRGETAAIEREIARRYGLVLT